MYNIYIYNLNVENLTDQIKNYFSYFDIKSEEK